MTKERKNIHHPNSQGMYRLRTIHKSRFKLWLKFLFDPKLSLFSRKLRNAKGSWIKYLSFRRKLVIAVNNINKLDSKIIDRILICLPDRQAE